MALRQARRHGTGNSNTVQPDRHLARAKPSAAPEQPLLEPFHRTESGQPPRPQSAMAVLDNSRIQRRPSDVNRNSMYDSVDRPPSRPGSAIQHIPSSKSNSRPWGPTPPAPIPQRPATAQPRMARPFSRASSSNSLHIPEFPDHRKHEETGFHATPDPRFPWRDPAKQLTTSTEWRDSADGTKIKPARTSEKQMPMCFKEQTEPPSGFHYTMRSKSPGGLMTETIRPTTSSSSTRKGLPPRPSTALGISSSGSDLSMSYPWTNGPPLDPNRTRPPFEIYIPPPPPEPSEPVCVETLQKIRRKVYEKAVNLKDTFRRFDEDKDGTVSRSEFKKALKLMNLDLPEKVLNGLLDALDRDGSGTVEYSEFAAMLKAKDCMGEYNPFLLERTYYDGSDLPDCTGKFRNKKLTAKDVNSAYDLHHLISHLFYKRYRNPREMFRDVDDNSNGAISSEEFSDKIKQIAPHVKCSPADIDNMIDVFQMSNAGQLTYTDFVDHFQQPDKWGFCSPYNAALRLTKCGAKCHPPMDSTTMEKHWEKQGRPRPRDLLKKKQQLLKDLVAEGKTIKHHHPVATIVIPGKTSKGLLDKFLLQALRQKFTTMRKNIRDMFRILDPASEGRISRDNFHRGMERLNMGIPSKVLDELISFVDSDNCGYVEMAEFVELMEPTQEDMRLPRHDEEDIREIETLLSQPASREGIPYWELNPVVQNYLKNKEMAPVTKEIQDALERKTTSMRDIFLKWDTDQDGFIDATELQKGLSSLNLGIPQAFNRH